MIVPVFTPPVRIDARNVKEFGEDVAEFLSRYESMVINCSDVSWIASSAMRLLATMSRDAAIALVYPSLAVHLLAATYGIDVQAPLRPIVVARKRWSLAGSAPRYTAEELQGRILTLTSRLFPIDRNPRRCQAAGTCRLRIDARCRRRRGWSRDPARVSTRARA